MRREEERVKKMGCEKRRRRCEVWRWMVKLEPFQQREIRVLVGKKEEEGWEERRGAMKATYVCSVGIGFFWWWLENRQKRG